MIYCRTCAAQRGWRQTGRENGNRPPVAYYACTTCGTTRVQYADVTDVEQLCRTVLERARRTGQVPDLADLDDALGHLSEAAWKLYLRWEPSRGVSFTAYASGLLPNKLKDWQRTTLGRDEPKPLATALSLDAPVGDLDDASASGLAALLAASGGDPSVDRATDLAWVLVRAGG